MKSLLVFILSLLAATGFGRSVVGTNEVIEAKGGTMTGGLTNNTGAGFRGHSETTNSLGSLYAPTNQASMYDITLREAVTLVDVTTSVAKFEPNNDPDDGFVSLIGQLGGTPTFTFGVGVNNAGLFTAPSFAGNGSALTGDNEVYGVGWNGDTTLPTKNAVYDKIETISGGGNFSTNASGDAAFTGTVTATAFAGDGSALTGISGGGVTNFLTILSNNATLFGIVGDNSTPCDIGISNALASGYLFLPPGIYKTTNVINVPAACVLQGVRGKTIITNSAGTTIFDSIVTSNTFTVRDIWFRGTNQTPAISKVSPSTQNGILLYGKGGVAENNIFDNFSGAAITSYSLDDDLNTRLNNAWIFANRITNCFYGVILGQTNDDTGEWIYVSENVIKANRFGILSYSANDDIHNNIVLDSAYSGVQFGSGGRAHTRWYNNSFIHGTVIHFWAYACMTSGPMFKGNYLGGTSATNIVWDTITSGVIEGNEFLGASENFIYGVGNNSQNTVRYNSGAGFSGHFRGSTNGFYVGYNYTTNGARLFLTIPEVGEVITATRDLGSSNVLTTATAANITNLTLIACGSQWEISGEVDYILQGATTTAFQGGSSQTSGTFDVFGTYATVPLFTTLLSDVYTQIIPTRRVTTAAPVYLIGQSTFSAGTMAASGTIRAVRVK